MDIGAILGMWNFFNTVIQGERIVSPGGVAAEAQLEPRWT
jgi:hypothetical protein